MREKQTGFKLYNHTAALAEPLLVIYFNYAWFLVFKIRIVTDSCAGRTFFLFPQALDRGQVGEIHVQIYIQIRKQAG